MYLNSNPSPAANVTLDESTANILLGTPVRTAPTGKLMCAVTSSLAGRVGSTVSESTYSVTTPKSLVILATNSSPVYVSPAINTELFPPEPIVKSS